MPTSDKEALRRRVEIEADFVNMKRFGYSLRRCEEKYPQGLTDDKAIAAALCIEEGEVERSMERIAGEIREILGVDKE